MQNIFEAIPIVLAIIATMFNAERYTALKDNGERLEVILATLACVLLIVAQTSWWVAVMTGTMEELWWANIVWSTFNTVTMISYIVAARK